MLGIVRIYFETYNKLFMIINRVWAMPNKWTFAIKPIKDLLNHYVGRGDNWIDPFAGKYSPAEFTNDLNINLPVKFHLPAEDFCKQLQGFYKGVIFDPPYSPRQISELYKHLKLHVTQLDTSANFYNKVKNAICDKIVKGGYAISFGWNSNGFGIKRGYEMIEILLVSHGGSHNDTIITVEKKLI